jgi:hypothetical protein
MAKKKGYALTDTNGQFDALFTVVTDVAKQQFPGGQIYSGNAEAMRIVCLPVPAFSVRFLLQQEGWPLGRFFQIVGLQESCKSSFGYEIMRWHGLVSGGGGILVPTEPKPAPELFRSIAGYDHPRMKYHTGCKTVQEWTAANAFWVKAFKDYMDGTKKEPGPGRKAPVCFMIDSLCACLTDGEFEKFDKEGTLGTHYAAQAAALKDWIMWVAPTIENWPFTLVGINHQRNSQEKAGIFTRTVRSITGGMALKFFQTTEIEMQRLTPTAPGKEVDHVSEDEKGIELQISVHKNSLAPHEKIKVEMLWYTDYDDRDPAGHFRQKTYFDWHSSSIDILARLLRGDGKRQKRLREVVDLSMDADTKKVCCPALGVTAKDRLKPREAGALLEQKLYDDVEFRNALYAETGVRRRYLFRPELDYREQIELAVRMASAAEKAAAPAATPFVDPEGAASA